MSGILILLVASAYFVALFGVAMVIDRRTTDAASSRFGGLVYALSLAVYCTSWTFYGSVGRAAVGGINFLAVYVGPILVFIVGMPLLNRLIAVAKAHHSTSIADFISARHGNSRALAGLVTVIAVVGILPYISLQLKAVGSSLDILLHYPNLVGPVGRMPSSVWSDPGFHTAMILAVFCIVFGTRHIDASEQHRGLVTVVALESMVKLLAFLAAGGFVVWGMFGGFDALFTRVVDGPSAALLDVAGPLTRVDWWAVVLASAAAIICLPRQFQVLVVENVRRRHLRTAGWAFPLYLVAINLFVLPIAIGGVLTLDGQGVAADSFMLTLPIAGGQPGLALFVFIGGISAATAMVLIEVTALSTMISNDLVMPVFLRRLMTAKGDPVRMVKAIRRIAILAVLLLSYAYLRVLGESRTLVGIGLMSFVAAAQFAPSLLGGLYLRRASRQGAIWGLSAGFVVWGYTLLLPSFAQSGWLPRDFITSGVLGITALAPHSLFGIDGLNEISHSLLWSLTVNIACYLVGTVFGRSAPSARSMMAKASAGTISVAAMQSLVGRFVGTERSAQGFADQTPDTLVDDTVIGIAERLLAGVIGSASARIVVAAALGGEEVDPVHMRGMLKDASAAIESSRAILADALDHLGQGVTVVDADLRLVSWNRRFVELLHLPDALVTYGAALEGIMRHNALNGECGPGDTEALVAERLDRLRQGLPFHDERELPDGSVLEVRGKPLPNGGYVTTYTDITRRHKAEQDLRRAYDDLDARVEARTHELSEQIRIRAATEAALRGSQEDAELARREAEQARQRSELILASAGEGVCGVDLEGRITFLNQAGREMLGLQDTEVIGAGLHALTHHHHADGSDYPIATCPLYQTLRDCVTRRVEADVYWHQDGTSFPVEYTATPIYQDGMLAGAVNVFRNIEARVRAEERGARNLAITATMESVLRQSLDDASLEATLDNALKSVLSLPWLNLQDRGCIFLVDDAHGKLRMVVQHNLSPQIADSCAILPLGHCLCGRVAASGEILFTDCTDHCHEISYAGMCNHGHYCVPVMSGNKVLGVFNTYVESGHRYDEDEARFLLMFADTLAGIIERKRIAEDLRDSQNRLLAITSTLFEGVLLVASGGDIVFSNRSAQRLLGSESLVGRPLDDVMTLLAQGEPLAFGHGPFRRVIETGAAVVDDDAVFATADGRRLTIAYAAAQLQEEGKPDAVVISFRDIAALKAAQREVLQASRLASVGQLAAGIAHEINTPIQYIGDNLRFIDDAQAKLIALATAGRDLAQAAAAADLGEAVNRFEDAIKTAKLPLLVDETPIAVRESLDGVAQIARIVLSMKEFSHPGTSAKTMTDLNRALESTLTVSRNVWKEVATVETAFDPSLPQVLCYASEMNQVFLNLIVNAAQAIETSGKPLPGRITITTSSRDGVVEIRVADTGTGVPETLKEKIFDPFFTTKAVGKGTGQGLAICRDVVVTKHGGSLEVADNDGGGAIFIVGLQIDDLAS